MQLRGLGRGQGKIRWKECDDKLATLEDVTFESMSVEEFGDGNVGLPQAMIGLEDENAG